MKALILTLALLMAPMPGHAACVLLLHGLARSDTSFLVMERVLRANGFAVVNQPYPSTSLPLDKLVPYVGTGIAACGGGRVEVVTHSMGGILLRAWRSLHPQAPLGRVVMLAPPNQGSELVDRLGPLPGFALINGPAGMTLGTGPEGVAHQLPAVDFELGVIAGTRSLNPFYSSILPGPDDGKVSVASTRVAGMADHVELAVTHTFLMNSPIVVAQTVQFLHDGHFASDMTLSQALRIGSGNAP